MITEGLDLIKYFESCKLTAYECPTSQARKTNKFWTIGWGNTVYEDGSKVKPSDKISQERADSLFLIIVADFEKQVKKLSKAKLNDYQLAALTSFAYNCGIANLKTSTLLKKVNANDFVGASQEFGKWTKSNGKVLNGLVTRRKKEAALFMQ